MDTVITSDIEEFKTEGEGGFMLQGQNMGRFSIFQFLLCDGTELGRQTINK